MSTNQNSFETYPLESVISLFFNCDRGPKVWCYGQGKFGGYKSSRARFNPEGAGGIITNIRPTKSLRLILGLISGINLAKINLLDLS